ncbi:MAG: lysozyme inhibitor LprI family protein [Methylovulum sp.]|nr:lysozyme inhibitor LprI family protein [Methylovulum sp.]
MKRIVAIVLLGLSAFAQQVNAECDNPSNDFDGLYCTIKIYTAADKALNDAYKKLKGQLNKEGKQALASGELVWMESRNSECSTLKDGEFFVNLDCAAKTTIERLHFLQDRSRECASSGCQNSKL